MSAYGSIDALTAAQRNYYLTGATRDAAFRAEQLKRLREALISREQDILEALAADLNKSEQESFVTEIGMVYKELSFAIKHLRKWVRPKRVKTVITHTGSRGVIHPEPYGTVLIIAPWNYPWQLSVAPLIGAMAAGNTVILKPSELTPNVAGVLASMIRETFAEEYITVVEGGPEISTQLLAQPMDYIFFTGSTQVGKIVMEAAAKQLIPVTLELGGKSPCIVHEDAPLSLTAKRIIFGKFTNAGQTCIAPDYLYVHRSIKDRLVQHMKEAITEFYGAEPLKSSEYGQIVSPKHFSRLTALLDDGKVLYGGKADEEALKIAPTLMDADWEMPVMSEEIFGPILPILVYDRLEEVIAAVQARPKPLALYLFTENQAVQELVLSRISFGGGCINDTLMHLATPYLPFGGVGESGMGAYHGEHSFHTFSHMKSVLRQTNRFDFSFRYPGKNGLKLLRKLMKP